ncbi:hypothetical protein B0H17DRAFT_1200198 [Mycena rosella]|uniref:Uncharacterized protein n=1 Tax=Mycena rosella TaxID=1033263 RepID=A0AAD7DJ00_MYCRO|nr:hypothetical protein B0H17DRAFT_1200198 [Mycena rosella]
MHSQTPPAIPEQSAADVASGCETFYDVDVWYSWLRDFGSFFRLPRESLRALRARLPARPYFFLAADERAEPTALSPTTRIHSGSRSPVFPLFISLTTKRGAHGKSRFVISPYLFSGLWQPLILSGSAQLEASRIGSNCNLQNPAVARYLFLLLIAVSQNIAELSVEDGKVALESPKGFPDAWLTRADEKYVIERAHWNTDPPPPDQQCISVAWRGFYGTRLLVCLPEYGVELGAIIVRFYFGITGCIIPVACYPEFEELMIVFTTAGPYDADGRKQFYLLIHDTGVEATRLLQFPPGFSSVTDFYLNRMPGLKCVQPVAGGAEAVRHEHDKCGYDMPGEDTATSTIDWSQIVP